MRDPNRLDDLYKQICEIHKKKAPDQRIGQFWCNMLGDYYKDTGIDPFFPECQNFTNWVVKYYGK